MFSDMWFVNDFHSFCGFFLLLCKCLLIHTVLNLDTIYLFVFLLLVLNRDIAKFKIMEICPYAFFWGFYGIISYILVFDPFWLNLEWVNSTALFFCKAWFLTFVSVLIIVSQWMKLNFPEHQTRATVLKVLHILIYSSNKSVRHWIRAENQK